MAQIEGMVGDALIARQLAVTQGRKLFVRGADGQPKTIVTKDGKTVKVEIRGLGDAVKNSTLKDNDVMEATAMFLTDKLAPERNGILHGRKTDYGSAQLSAQTVLVAFMLIEELAAFERGEDLQSVSI
jgi:hypothetical protein